MNPCVFSKHWEKSNIMTVMVFFLIGNSGTSRPNSPKQLCRSPHHSTMTGAVVKEEQAGKVEVKQLHPDAEENDDGEDDGVVDVSGTGLWVCCQAS
jgi:hypothetical protein